MAEFNMHRHHWGYDRTEEGLMRRSCYERSCGIVEVRVEKGVWYESSLTGPILRAQRHVPTTAEAAAIRATARGHRQRAVAEALATEGYATVEFRGLGFKVAGHSVMDTYYGGTKIDTKSVASLRRRLRDVGFVVWRHRDKSGRLEMRVVFKERIRANV